MAGEEHPAVLTSWQGVPEVKCTNSRPIHIQDKVPKRVPACVRCRQVCAWVAFYGEQVMSMAVGIFEHPRYDFMATLSWWY